MNSNILLRKLMEATANSKEKNEEEYEDEEVVVGTSTVLDKSGGSGNDEASVSNFQKGKEQLKNVENVINNVSHKMKSNTIIELEFI